MDAKYDMLSVPVKSSTRKTGPDMARLKEYYRTVLIEQLKKTLSYKNVMQVPRLDKIVINMGVGKATSDSQKIQAAINDLMRISGQKPIITHASKSIAQFKLRKGMPIGCKVTLRRERMYEFLDRLITIVLPRIRDFRGIAEHSLDGHGNLSIGLKDQAIFPEVDYDRIDQIRGMDIVIVTTAQTNHEAKTLLKGFNLPFIETKVEE